MDSEKSYWSRFNLPYSWRLKCALQNIEKEMHLRDKGWQGAGASTKLSFTPTIAGNKSGPAKDHGKSPWMGHVYGDTAYAANIW